MQTKKTYNKTGGDGNISESYSVQRPQNNEYTTLEKQKTKQQRRQLNCPPKTDEIWKTQKLREKKKILRMPENTTDGLPQLTKRKMKG